MIEEIRKVGACIRLIGDGDLSAGISAAVIGTRRSHLMVRRRPEGVLTAAALRCSTVRFLPPRDWKPQDAERLAKNGVTDTSGSTTRRPRPRQENHFRLYTGVTDGNILKGVRFSARHPHLFDDSDPDETPGAFNRFGALEKRPDIKVRLTSFYFGNISW